MIKDYNKYVQEKAIEALNTNNFNGSIIFNKPMSYEDLLITILQRTYRKAELNSRIVKTIIITKDYDTIVKYRNIFIKDKILDKAFYSKDIKLYTASFIEELTYTSRPNFCIFLDIENPEFIKIAFDKIIAKWNIALYSTEDINPEVNKFFKTIYKVRKDDLIANGYLNSITEVIFDIELEEERANLYEEYNNYITQTHNIFGEIGNILHAYRGNENITGEEVRENIAKAHGWHRDLDLSDILDKQIDDMYNPQLLFERCKSYFEIVKLRKRIISDAPEKIEEILRIVQRNFGSKILIVSKRPEFARSIKDAINDNFKGGTFNKGLFKEDITYNCCEEYHGDRESSFCINPITGQYLTYKTGKNKGHPKVFGSKTLSDMAKDSFNMGYVSVLSATGKLFTDTELKVDLIIYTSAKIDSIHVLNRKIKGIDFNNKPLIFNLATPVEKELYNRKIVEFSSILTEAKGYDINNY